MFKAESILSIDADNAKNRDVIVDPQTVPNSDPEEDDVGVVEDFQEAVLDSSHDNKTDSEEMFPG